MRIFVLGTRGFPNVQGGVEKHCEELFPRIASLGYEVIVCNRTPYISKENRHDEINGIKYIQLWCPKIKSLEAIIHTFLGIIIARFKSIDILHIQGIGPALLTPFARVLGIKVVITHHGSDYKRQKWGIIAKKILKLGEYLGLKYANKTIVITKIIEEELGKKYGKIDSIVIPNGISTKEFESNDEILGKYNLTKNKYFFTACRFVPEKGLHDLIEAFEKYNGTEYKFVIAGDSDHDDNYSKSIKEIARKNNVILTGQIYGYELKELFINAGLFVLPSYHEGLPIALLEAMSYNLPVLVSNIPPHIDLELNPIRYFKTGDVNDLRNKMITLIELGIDDKEKEEYQYKIKNYYNWDIIAEKTIEVYNSIL